jgi:NADH-quinone oxidoreductase subunit J
MFGVLAYVTLDFTEDSTMVDPSEEQIALTTTAISDAYLGAYLVPLIAVSFVLLAAAIGAIVLARKD